MDRNRRIALAACGLAGLLAVVIAPGGTGAQAVRPTAWEYKVEVLSYNPGDRARDDSRARDYARLLNEQAAAGWEPVTLLLSRDATQTIGGAVVTRDTTAFVSFRRPRP